MGSPTTTARGTPLGARLLDGYRTTIAFAANTTVSLWEKTIKPPGLDGGEAIDTTTMLTNTYRQRTSRALKTLTDVSGTFGYDPRVYYELISLINLESSITIHFPDLSSLDFFGFLRSMEPNENAEGAFPELRCTITCTNTDPADGSEAGPVYKTANGTVVSP